MKLLKPRDPHTDWLDGPLDEATPADAVKAFGGKALLVEILTKPCHIGDDLICSAHRYHPLPGRVWTELAGLCDDEVELDKFINEVAREEE